MISPAVGAAVLIALIGWLATLRVISNARISPKLKQWLLVPSWVPWMALALGAPIMSGMLPWQDALNMGGAMTVGMAVSIVLGGRQTPR
ncbi:MAG TPA: hypothetical protein VFS21_11250 [Roseiflexaceae bacterium]|nr:hypothetical protein [Roseiflexaceae bacterium]